jgi:hypothetical protein
MKHYLLIAVLALAGLQLGCMGHSVKPGDPYLRADRQTKNAVDPVLRLTAEDHPELKPAIDDIVESWELRLQKAGH